VLVDGSLRTRLLACRGDTGARALCAELGCTLVPVDDPGAVLDVDRVEDLAGLEATAGGLRWKEALWPSPS
jgi:CTP:molybdopterin cytidylyltransferase MocA